MSVESTIKSNPVMALKGSMHTLMAIQILDDSIKELSYQLDEKIKQAPNFFQYAPLILDFQYLTNTAVTIDLAALIELLKSKKFIPIGVRGIPANLKQEIIDMGLAVFPEDKSNRKTTSLGQGSLEPLTSRVITQPVRSGQQIYVPNGDLIVLSSVSHGAEILADGHIHVYGSLRGRALAGVMGNTEAMIICRSLEAELVSIAGQYRLSDDLKTGPWKQSVAVQLQEGRLNILLV